MDRLAASNRELVAKVLGKKPVDRINPVVCHARSTKR